MRWLRDAGWVVAAVAVVVVLVTRPKPAKLPDPQESRAALEKLKSEYEAKKAARDAKLEADIARIQTDATLERLRLFGREYRRHLAKSSPKDADVADFLDAMRSHRDDKPFAVVWGVDVGKLPDGGRGHLLAWEQTADPAGSRCVLLADGKTAKVLTAAEFEKAPRATAPK